MVMFLFSQATGDDSEQVPEEIDTTSRSTDASTEACNAVAISPEQVTDLVTAYTGNAVIIRKIKPFIVNLDKTEPILRV